ncbi:MAG TPA: hypothetical protein PLN56_06575 [Methanoregulaceae archaeon]|nr:MAG: hypothetical protein IPI71_09825 [Methanolinea sp.]HON81852.1 hypothetical protein [Methanoregulaceae archaeon]HPD10643.1 hypothetical protein [Methanoregulaceae archaeon]HRT15774.1 hypothetical protein [Methanoregulaceae archaeon]HRU31288.1 hypothetical protein [Methanoregulaceae archaeon]
MTVKLPSAACMIETTERSAPLEHDRSQATLPALSRRTMRSVSTLEGLTWLQ